MASFTELSRKKVAGVPVIYLAGAFVVILAIVAWKMKPSTPAPEASPSDGGVDPNTPLGDNTAADYSLLATHGTVTTATAAPTADPAVQQTNDDWYRAAVDYLVTSNQASPSQAESAMSKYLHGDNLTFEEGTLKDKAILKLKLPPEPLATIGVISPASPAPAQRQFTNFPGGHTVKGPNDNTPTLLAQLYYGNGDAAHSALIVQQNARLGTGSVTYPVGTGVVIPAWHDPKYYITPKDGYSVSGVAAANGTTATSIGILNPGMTFPVKKGTKVRVS